MKKLERNYLAAFLFMFALLVILCVITSLFMSVFATSDMQKTATVNVEISLVYDCPAPTCNVIGVIGQGDVINISGKEINGYLPFHYFGITHYIHAGNVK